MIQYRHYIFFYGFCFFLFFCFFFVYSVEKNNNSEVCAAAAAPPPPPPPSWELPDVWGCLEKKSLRYPTVSGYKKSPETWISGTQGMRKPVPGTRDFRKPFVFGNRGLQNPRYHSKKRGRIHGRNYSMIRHMHFSTDHSSPCH